MAKGIVQDWSPLFMGHPGEWLENTYEHPLGPILDVASFVTLGAGAAARGAAVVSKAAEAGRVARATEGLVAAVRSELARSAPVLRPRTPPLLAVPWTAGGEALTAAAKAEAARTPQCLIG